MTWNLWYTDQQSKQSCHANKPRIHADKPQLPYRLQPCLRESATNRFRGESTEILVERVNSATALDELHSTGDMAIRANDNHAALLRVEAELFVGGGLGVGDADIRLVVGIDVAGVGLKKLGKLSNGEVVLVGCVDHQEGEEGGVWVVTLEV